ncbi:MAG: CPBP family intramembrane metalloprotease [Microcystis aeruginosa G11-01]|nr:CPBP family intramembrane metalloprotease [Microcystis aeruginosa G11-01]
MLTKKIRLGILGFVVLAGLVALLVLLFTPKPTTPPQVSDYQISQQLAVNRPNYFPLQQNIDPKNYRSRDSWVGRLILPKPEEFKKDVNQDNDWAWFEVYEAPLVQKNLVGKKVRLAWQRSQVLDRYLNLVTTNIQFTEAAKASEKQGNLLPVRLNGRSQVGPLQALAGARPKDDVLISFPQAEITANPEQIETLRVEKMPMMVTGRYVALVNILGEAKPQLPKDIPAQCPGASPCSSELMRIQHYNPQSGKFDGIQETIRIPQQPLVSGGRFISTPRQLADSPEGKEGWYIYGAQSRDGLFTVQALQPRSLFQLQTTEIVFGKSEGSDYINSGNWHKTPERKGTAQRVLVDSRSDLPKTALKLWKEGDRGLGIHLFGGIGGEKGESIVGGTVTGHFSYFFPQVIRDRFTNELQWDINYYQVYAHNPQGILSGSQSWENYLGNLQRGWLNSRPVSNVIMKLDVLEDYNFGTITLSPLAEFQRQLEIMMSRYRTGDGTGSASVSPAASCVQDSNQALYITIEVLKQQVSQNSIIIDWLTKNPNNSQNQRFQRLVQLSDRLTEILVPKGVIRPDWKYNAQTLAATVVDEDRDYAFVQKDTLANSLLSWQSMLPRVSHDVISKLFLEQGASLWFLRTNQVGGVMPEIFPVAPTNLFGDTPFISSTLRHILAALIFLPNAQGWGKTFGLLLVYAAIAIPVGLRFNFLKWQPKLQSPIQLVIMLIALFLIPAFGEELIFRVILLPYPGTVPWEVQIGFGLLSLILFVLYHPLNALLFYKAGNPLFFNPIFLGLAALLGLVCTIAYFATGSIWTISILHWIVVVIWLLGFNGLSALKISSKI